MAKDLAKEPTCEEASPTLSISCCMAKVAFWLEPREVHGSAFLGESVGVGDVLMQIYTQQKEKKYPVLALLVVSGRYNNTMKKGWKKARMAALELAAAQHL